jgi:hypothetical protein
LQCYADYVDLIEETINQALNKEIDSKTANTVGMLTGYGLQAIRESSGGKMKMSVFLKDMTNVKVEMLTPDEMDRFLQGNDEVQIEVLKQLEDRGGIVEAEVTMTAKTEQKAKLDIPLLAEVSGIEPGKVRDALSGEGEKPVATHRQHKWERAIGGGARFCMNCGTERQMLQPADMTAPCSGQWGME